MFAALKVGLSLIVGVFGSVNAKFNRMIGRQDQVCDDLKKNNAILKKELERANNRPSTADAVGKLRDGKF